MLASFCEFNIFVPYSRRFETFVIVGPFALQHSRFSLQRSSDFYTINDFAGRRSKEGYGCNQEKHRGDREEAWGCTQGHEQSSVIQG